MFRLTPALMDYIWGGTRLKEEYGKQTPLPAVAESWEVSAHRHGMSVIRGGEYDGMALADYVRLHPEAVGAGFSPEDAFPILVKLIDARENLSVQVHPGDDYARLHENSPGKTEMWYILEAEPDACLYLGVNRDLTKEEFARRIADNTVEEALLRCPVAPGEAYMVRAGTLHAIGRGIVLAEIQQSSDITYRVYDYGRLGQDGKPRPLHIAQALEVAELCFRPQAPFADPPAPEGAWEITRCPYFTLSGIAVDGRLSFEAPAASFRALVCIEGEAQAGELILRKGDTAFLPAGEVCALTGRARLLAAGWK